MLTSTPQTLCPLTCEPLHCDVLPEIDGVYLLYVLISASLR